MQIPNSIEKLTEVSIADPFAQTFNVQSINIDEIIFFIKQKLTMEAAKPFNEGLVFHKSTFDEKNFLKSFLMLYSDVIVRSIKVSDVDDEQKKNIAEYYSNFVKALVNIYDVQYDIINTLNNKKKIIDVQEISFIMLGYAIDTPKKIYNAKERLQ